MSLIFNRNDLPTQLFSVPELDFSGDLFVDRLSGLWFRLGAVTLKPQPDGRGVEDLIRRQSVLLSPEGFAEIYDKLESVGDVIRDLGKPDGFLRHDGDRKEYAYTPFHRFEISSTPVTCEPLVFIRTLNSVEELFINPDLKLFFELEEKTNDLWWDAIRGVEVLRRSTIENLQTVEVRVSYLKKYLQQRQLSLMIGHYRHLHLLDPSPDAIEAYLKEDIEFGSKDQGSKAIVQNWGLQPEFLGKGQFLPRRLHLWYEIKPPVIDIDDPWAEEPPFDPYEFTLPTANGPVAPGRFSRYRYGEEGEFKGSSCDFMDRVYFNQEVLSKYEGSSGCKVSDDGSVSCRDNWSLWRSTSRIGNELLSTAIGDFAEGVPLEEWPHWKQYAVDSPSVETRKVLAQEQTIPNAVNALVDELESLNAMFQNLANTVNVELLTPLWCGSVESPAGRQLKWVYPTTADDDEFLKRVTFLSTLVIDGLTPKSLRRVVRVWGEDLHRDQQNQSLGSRKLLERLYAVIFAPINKRNQSLGSRKLLERVSLITVLIEDFQPRCAEIPELVRVAEGQSLDTVDTELESELRESYCKTRKMLAPLAFLYDLRSHGGVAHPPDSRRVKSATENLGLSAENWHRSDYLNLLNIVTDSVRKTCDQFSAAVRTY